MTLFRLARSPEAAKVFPNNQLSNSIGGCQTTGSVSPSEYLLYREEREIEYWVVAYRAPMPRRCCEIAAK